MSDRDLMPHLVCMIVVNLFDEARPVRVRSNADRANSVTHRFL